jgi:hypothetical protein
MEYEVVLWRIGYAGSSEGPYRIEEVFERLKERRWTGEVMVHARGRTDNWVPIEDVPEFAPLVAQLRGTYLGPAGEVQWRASDDAADRGIDHNVWTETPSQGSSLSHHGGTWPRAGIEVQEESFGFLSPQAPPAAAQPKPIDSEHILAPARPGPTASALAPATSPASIPPAPVPRLRLEPPESAAARPGTSAFPRRLVPEGTRLEGFRPAFTAPGTSQVILPTATSLEFPTTRIITAPPDKGIEVAEQDFDFLLPIASSPANVPAKAPISPGPVPPAARPITTRMPSLPASPVSETAVPQAVPYGQTRVITERPSVPGIVVTEDAMDAFLR